MHDSMIVGIDLAKSSFQIHQATKSGRVLDRLKKTRKQLPVFLAKMPKSSLFMEACASANYWARLAKSHGHEVKLIAPQYVKPFVKSQKNDAADAEAICEAGTRSNMRFVPIKSVAQQDLQSLHRIRSRYVGNRTALYNQMRAFLLENGLAVTKSMKALRTTIADIISADPNVTRGDVSELMRGELTELLEEAQALDAKVLKYDKKMEIAVSQDERCQSLMKLPGVGPITATAIVASVGSCGEFKNSRQFSAWLGLVPQQHSTGGKTRLSGLSKRGDKYLRTLVIHGARAVLMNVGKKKDPRSQWADKLKTKVGMNKAAVAMANKNARTMWAILHRGSEYDPYYKSSSVAPEARPKRKKKSPPPANRELPNVAALDGGEGRLQTANL